MYRPTANLDPQGWESQVRRDRRNRDMPRTLFSALLAATALVAIPPAWAGQAPAAASDPDIPVSHRDRVYAAEQFSNTVSYHRLKRSTPVAGVRFPGRRVRDSLLVDSRRAR